MANNIEFRILGDVKDIEDKLSKAKKSFDGLGKAASVAFVGLTASAYGFINAAREQEVAIQSLNQALKNHRNYTDEASKELQKYAGELQNVSLFGDEVIIQAQSMIASFGFEGEELKRLTKSTLDLAQAKGMDLVSAADLVGKSVGSSTNAMTRYGVSVEGAAGSSQRAESAIRNINKLFGGQAEAATKGLGSITQLQNAMSDLGEEIGGALAPTVVEITTKLKDFVNLMKENPEIAKTTAEVIKLGIAVTGITAGVWLLNGAWLAVSGTLTAIVPVLATIAASPAFLAVTAITSVGLLGKATWDWYQAESAVSRELEEQNKVLEESFAARRLTAGQVMADARMRIEIIKTVSAAEVEAEKQRFEAVKRVDEDINLLKTEMQAISATRTQQEIDELILKYQYQYEAEVNYLNMQQQLYANNNALTLEKQTELEDARAEARAKYDGIEQLAREQQQSKMSALDQKGLEIAKKVNADKIASLSSTLQQAAQLNSKFANAYKAVAIGEAIMSTAAGVARAFKDYPFPASLGVAALVGASGAIQIATIASQSFAVGTPEIPKDMNANVHKGEMIVPATFSEAIRSGELSLSGGGNTTNDNGIVMDFTGATFNGVTESFVREIFTRAAEAINSRTLSPLPTVS